MLHFAIFVIAVSFPAALTSGNNGTRQQCFRPEVGFQCTLDCKTLGYCDEKDNWIPIGACPPGQICSYAKCVEETTCPTSSASNVFCTDSSLKMPNLNDATCRQYYTCDKEEGAPYGYGVLQSCPAGQVFDPCSGECATRLCPAYASCTTDLTILAENKRLTYVCDPSFVLWTNCPKGVFVHLSDGPQCVEGAFSECKNGNGSDSGSGGGGGETCSAAGRYPIAGTDCGYLQCFSDLTSTAFPCRGGYHYDNAAKECVVGACTGPPVKLQDDDVDAQK